MLRRLVFALLLRLRIAADILPEEAVKSFLLGERGFLVFFLWRLKGSAAVALKLDLADLSLLDVHAGLTAVSDVCGHHRLAIDHLEDLVIDCAVTQHVVDVH